MSSEKGGYAMEYDKNEKNDKEQLPPSYQKYHLVSFDVISGYDVRPGFYDINGATAIPGGVNFTLHSIGATSCELLLFQRGVKEPYAVIPFPEHYKIGHVYSMIVFGLSIYEFEYAYRLDGPYEPENGLIFDKTKILLDPYAKAVVGQSRWGTKSTPGSHYTARVVKDDFDWKDLKQPHLPVEDLIIYELHVRGFTKDSSSETSNPGTFQALQEKLPYLKELGINAIELMPIFEFDEMLDAREYNGKTLFNYWGYNTVSFFAPNTGYAASLEFNREGNELKELVKACNENGIEVILDVVFNHTAEGDENGPYISFKGFDNNIYYLLTPQGFYYNFSGCGNTLNCNHPIVQRMILECLRYWVITYRVDGFRFDLASILDRNEDGSPMNQSPLLQSLAYDPILGKVKLIAEAWDAGGLYQVGAFSSWNKRWAEWNGRYRDDIRKFMKADPGLAQSAANRIAGSPDIYSLDKKKNGSINFITCHDGFTMYDLFSYNEKHNEMNGWDNTDGNNDNESWNCGVEGETDNPEIQNLRKRMIENAFTILLCSRGTPMFLAGDEFCNTQYGNNNAYCQDNMISWLDWKMLEKNKDVYCFVQKLISFRKEHPILRHALLPCSMGFPDTSFHGVQPWSKEYDYYDRYVGVMFAGWDKREKDQADIVYLAVNTYWEDLNIKLPQLPRGVQWKAEISTSEKLSKEDSARDGSFLAEARSVTVFTVNRIDSM